MLEIFPKTYSKIPETIAIILDSRLKKQFVMIIFRQSFAFESLVLNIVSYAIRTFKGVCEGERMRRDREKGREKEGVGSERLSRMECPRAIKGTIRCTCSTHSTLYLVNLFLKFF